MTRRWFGTDGIRGRAGEGPLATPFLRRLGHALGEQARAEAGGADDVAVLLARDTRESGPEITAALARGLCAAGVGAVDLGVLPTPGLPMAMRVRGAARGIVVSASHNPWRDNGVKIFGAGGHKLSDEQERSLEARVDELGHAPERADDGASLGVEDGAAAYVAAQLERFAGLDLSPFTLAVDCAHGAASRAAPAVLEGLGARVTALCCEPDGRNINEACGSTDLGALQDAVRAGSFDLGLAFDGDADRVLMVDAAGRICTGDHMLGFLGTWLAERGELPERTVVATVMSNLGLERLLSAGRIRLARTKVGDRYVHAAMREGGYALGGEASGHLLFGAEHDYTGDGLYTALRVLGGLIDTGRDLASVVDAVEAVPQVLLNVPVPARPPTGRLPRLGERVAAAEREHGDRIRIVLRYSGTEDLARVMVEGLDDDVVRSLADELAALWIDEIEVHGPQGAGAP